MLDKISSTEEVFNIATSSLDPRLRGAKILAMRGQDLNRWSSAISAFSVVNSPSPDPICAYRSRIPCIAAYPIRYYRVVWRHCVRVSIG